MTWSRYVFLDGILVPSTSVSCSWSAKGQSLASVTLVPSRKSRHILPSTHVHIFHAEAGLAARKKTVNTLDNPGAFGDRSLFADEAASTVGEAFFPSFSTDVLDTPGMSMLLRGMPYHGFHLRFAGEVASKTESEGAGSAAQVTLSCRGYDHLMDVVQAIQLTRGTGTLADEERRFFGQEDPVFVGSGRRAFFDGMADLIGDAEHGLAETCRRLASIYPARISSWAAHRFAWTRFADQIAAVDNDTTVARLLDTRAFRRYLKEVVQAQYLMPLRGALQSVLDFPMHRIVAIPTPAYFPLYEDPTQTTVTTDNTSRSGVYGGGRVAAVSIPARPAGPVLPPDWDVPGSEYYGGILISLTDPDTGEMAWGWEYTGLSLTLDTARRPAITVEGSISNGGRTLRFSVPEGYNAGEASYEITLDGELFREVIRPLPDQAENVMLSVWSDEFYAGATYEIPFDDASPEGQLEPRRRRFEAVVVISERPRGVRSVPDVQQEVTPPEPEADNTLLSSRRARMASYAILPHLWWAAPPACNVVIPDEIKGWSVNDPGIDKPTRLFGKISPGRSGSSRVLIDKFSAPNLRELNEGAANPEDNSRDPEQLYKSEILGGPRPSVYYFERLHRLVGDDEWESYLRQFISVEFWNKRLGTVTAQLIMKASIRPVTGTTMLVIPNVTPTPTEFQSAEQRHWLDRLAVLERMRRSLQTRRNSMRGNAGFAERLRAQLRGMYAVQEFVGIIRGGRYAAEFDISIASIQDGRTSMFTVKQAITAGMSTAEMDSASTAYHPLLGGDPNSYDGQRVTEDPSRVSSLLTTDAESAGNILTSRYPNPYPPQDRLELWYNEVETNIYDPSACRAALQTDIDLIEQFIEVAREELRSLGTEAPAATAYLGYVEAIQESTTPGGEQLAVTLTHVRALGADMDWDGLGGDDPEALIAFGEDGFADPRYAADSIGQSVYLPIYGCGSVVDTEEAQLSAEVTSEADAPRVEGLAPVDCSDVRALFSHTSTCGEDYSSPNSADGVAPAISTALACKAIIDRYQALVASGARSEKLFEWLEFLRARSTTSVADCYRGMPTVMGPDESSPIITDVSRDDNEIYGDGRTLAGFFAQSFLAGDVDYDRVRVLSVDGNGAESEVGLSEDEKDLLKDRVDRIREYLRSVEDKTFTRSG